jgi:hypothetical protein
MTHCASFPLAPTRCASMHHGSRCTSGSQRLLCSTEPRNVIGGHTPAGKKLRCDRSRRSIIWSGRPRSPATPDVRGANRKVMDWLMRRLLHRRKIPPEMRLSAALLTIIVTYNWWPATLDEIAHPPQSARVLLALAAVLYLLAEIVEIFLE